MTEGPIIKTPRGQIFLDQKGLARLEFNTNFHFRFQRQYTEAQKFLDNEILRQSEPYIPLLTGTLIKTGWLGTDLGSGRVEWIAPYARAQYYSPRKPGSTTGKLRGPFWFERMKKIKGKSMVANARKIAGGGVR